MLKRIAVLSALTLLVFAKPSIAGEPLQLKLFVSNKALHLLLTNISDRPVKVLPYFRYASEGEPLPVQLNVIDTQGRRLYIHHTIDSFFNKPNNWTFLQPAKSVGSTVSISELAEWFRFRKEQYSVTATYSGTYYSEDGAEHKIQLISNLVKLNSDVDEVKEYCDSHYPDGRARFPGGLDVPRRAIEINCR